MNWKGTGEMAHLRVPKLTIDLPCHGKPFRNVECGFMAFHPLRRTLAPQSRLEISTKPRGFAECIEATREEGGVNTCLGKGIRSSGIDHAQESDLMIACKDVRWLGLAYIRIYPGRWRLTSGYTVISCESDMKGLNLP